MTVRITETTFNNTYEILQFPDHYVAEPVRFLADTTLAVTENGRKIVKAGTVYPANDATATGIVFTDLDVTDGEKQGAIITHGYIKKSKMPVAPSAAAITALKLIAFR